MDLASQTACFVLPHPCVSSAFFYLIETFCLRQSIRHRDNYISWWLWPHKPTASFFYIIEFFLFSFTSSKLFVCVKDSKSQIASSAGGFVVTTGLHFSSTSLSFFFFLLFFETFCLRQGIPQRIATSASGFGLTNRLLLSSTSLTFFNFLLLL